jgi:Flp pilus assembly protein TadG
MKRKDSAIVKRRPRLCRRDSLGVRGAVAVELGLLVPLLVLLAIGIVDFGNLLQSTQAIAAAARIGAQYARDSTTCKSGIQILSSPPVNAACTTGITNTMTQSLNYSAGQLTFPASFPLTCECDDATSIACGNNACATAGRPAPDRVFITVSASQSFTSMIAWPGMPTAVSGGAEIRLQ